MLPEDKPSEAAPAATAPPPATVKPAVVVGMRPRSRWPLYVLLLVLAGGLASGGYWWGHRSAAAAKTATAGVSGSTARSNAATSGAAGAAGHLQLDTSKSYGNKYANGLLPVGDGRYSTTGAEVGKVYACTDYARNLMHDSGGAQVRGPWFTADNTEYDINKKVSVSGSRTWQASLSITDNNGTRTIITNDLPNHPTGIFPIVSTDPAYRYDRNPNSIESQSLTYALPDNPAYGSPNCMGGEAGVMLTGVALFNAFDAGGRDAGAWEVQDSCSGHPQKSGEYHYHTLSSCIKDSSVHTIIGYALDGFPITGPQVAPGNILTTSDLDECHGITGPVQLNGKTVTTYHYVMTQDFPYSVSCFRAKAITPPGLPG